MAVTQAFHLDQDITLGHESAIGKDRLVMALVAFQIVQQRKGVLPVVREAVERVPFWLTKYAQPIKEPLDPTSADSSRGTIDWGSLGSVECMRSSDERPV